MLTAACWRLRCVHLWEATCPPLGLRPSGCISGSYLRTDFLLPSENAGQRQCPGTFLQIRVPRLGGFQGRQLHCASPDPPPVFQLERLLFSSPAKNAALCHYPGFRRSGLFLHRGSELAMRKVPLLTFGDLIQLLRPPSQGGFADTGRVSVAHSLAVCSWSQRSAVRLEDSHSPLVKEKRLNIKPWWPGPALSLLS